MSATSLIIAILAGIISYLFFYYIETIYCNSPMQWSFFERYDFNKFIYWFFVILCLLLIAKDFYYFAHDYMSLERLTLKSFIELGTILACLRRAREED